MVPDSIIYWAVSWARGSPFCLLVTSSVKAETIIVLPAWFARKITCDVPCKCLEQRLLQYIIMTIFLILVSRLYRTERSLKSRSVLQNPAECPTCNKALKECLPNSISIVFSEWNLHHDKLYLPTLVFINFFCVFFFFGSSLRWPFLLVPKYCHNCLQVLTWRALSCGQWSY